MSLNWKSIQEKNLIRDYNDMLSSPKKLEMFRQEQEKRHRVQRIGPSWASKVNRQSSTPSVGTKSLATKPTMLLAVKIGSDAKNTVSSAGTSGLDKALPGDQSQVPNQPVSNSDPIYRQFLQAFATQASSKLSSLAATQPPDIDHTLHF